MTTIEASIWLGEQQVKLYKSNPKVYMNCFCSGEANRKIMAEYYRILTDRKKVTQLEILEPGFKKELKKTAIEIGDQRLDTKGLMDLCKLLLIISNESL